MAEAEEIGQIAVIPDKPCELCEVNEVSWKCLNCDELICHHCKTIHLRSKFAKDHKVVNLKGTEKRQSSSTSGTAKCQKHTTEDLQMYCTSCAAPVCHHCIASASHKNHDFSLIKDIVESKQTELADIVEKSKEKINKYEQVIHTISSLRSDFDIEISKRIGELKIRNEELIGKLNKFTSDTVQQLQHLQEQNRKKTTELDRRLQNELTELRKLVEQCEDKRADPNAETIQFVADMKETLDQYKLSDPLDIDNPPKIVTKDVDNEELKAFLGTLVQTSSKVGQRVPSVQQSQKEASSVPSPEIDVKVLNTFTVKNKSHVAAVGKDQAWLWFCSYGCRNISLVSSNGQVVKNITTGFDVHDLAIAKSGELLLTVYFGNKIKKFTQDNKFTDIYQAKAGYKTQGINVTDNGNIVVCLFNYKGSKLVEITTTGQHIRTIQYDPVDNKELFNDPLFISVNINEDIVVVDGTSKIVVVNKSGHLGFVYDGQGRGLKTSFNPQNTAIDKHGHIIISDRSNSVLHMLDKNGSFLRYLLTEKQGCNQPYGLSIDTSGVLWMCQKEFSEVMRVKYF